MAEFTYKAKTEAGKEVSGSLTANDENAAVGELRRRNLTVVTINKTSGGGGGGGGKKDDRPWYKRDLLGGAVTAKTASVKNEEIIVFTRQLATMVSAGIPLLESLEILAEQSSNAGFQAVLRAVCESVRGGEDFSTSLGKYPRCFTNIYVNMVRAGEAAGQLDEILNRLSEYLESAAKLRGQIKSAMTYPVVSICLILAITIFLLVFVIPKFEAIFTSLNIDLPTPTKILLATSKFLAGNIFLIAVALAGLAFAGYSWIKTDPGRRQLDWFLLNMPVFGPLFQKVVISRFARTFATLIASGVPILGALDIVAATSGNKLVEEAIIEAQQSVRQGDSLANPLAKSPVFPPMVTRMIAIGEKSGALEQLLVKISEFYDQQVEASVEGLTALIEPIMISVMGLMVGGMVLAIFLPIFKITSAMR